MEKLSNNKNKFLFRIIIPAYPAFNIYSVVAHKTTALGPIYIASAAREIPGWEVEVIDENNLRRLAPFNPSGMLDHEFIQLTRPADAVGFYGGLTSTIPRLYQLSRFYKEMGIITLAGGQHFVPETIPEALDSGIDFIILGEGEYTIKEILTALSNKSSLETIAGLTFKKGGKIITTRPRPPIDNLDNLPLADFSLLRYANLELFPIGRVRGCGMNCEFCTVKGKPYYGSPERFIEQISKIAETMPAREFFIVDDLFGQDRRQTIKLCSLLKKYQEKVGRNFSLMAQIRLDKAKDTELLQAMRNANIRNVAIGFESPIEEELKAMRKKLKPEIMIEYTQTFHKMGFFIHGMFIFGYPMKEKNIFSMNTDERITHFKRFIRKAHIDTIQVLLATPLPGTELRERLLAENRIFPVKIVGWEYYDGNFPLFEPDPPLTPEEMRRAINKIMGRFYHIRSILRIILHVISMPHIIFYLHNIRSAWKVWVRKLRSNIFRIIGWRIFRNWHAQFRKGTFLKKLREAKTYTKKP